MALFSVTTAVHFTKSGSTGIWGHQIHRFVLFLYMNPSELTWFWWLLRLFKKLELRSGTIYSNQLKISKLPCIVLSGLIVCQYNMGIILKIPNPPTTLFFWLEFLVRPFYPSHLKEIFFSSEVPIIEITHFPIKRFYLWENKQLLLWAPMENNIFFLQMWWIIWSN